MASDKESLSVGGFLFLTEKDAQLARAEEQKIEYLEARIDYSSPESIRYVYEKSIHERVFKTPIGYQYLKRQQEFLKSRPEEAGTVRDIPLYTAFEGEIREHGNPVPSRILPSDRKEKEKARFMVSLIMNVMLAAAIVFMFYISFVSEQPNIINYERALTNRYASWEQELTERERVVREKEKELNIQP